MALDVDSARDDVMRHPPRGPGERVLDARRLFAIGRAGAVVSLGTVTLLAATRSPVDPRTAASTASTTFVLFQLFNTLNARADDGPLPSRHQPRDRTLGLCLAGVLAARMTAVRLPWARGVLGAVPPDAAQWAVCRGTASTVLLAEHLRRVAIGGSFGGRRAGREPCPRGS
ncbi:hypothetical protein GCM10027162_52800 [Streptomyces incanus]